MVPAGCEVGRRAVAEEDVSSYAEQVKKERRKEQRAKKREREPGKMKRAEWRSKEMGGIRGKRRIEKTRTDRD